LFASIAPKRHGAAYRAMSSVLPVVHLWLCIDSQLRALRLFDWPFSPLLERLSTIVPFWIVFGVLGTAWWAVIGQVVTYTGWWLVRAVSGRT